MKKVSMFFCIICICSSCTKKTSTGNHTPIAITQIYDITDSLQLVPSEKPVFALCNFEADNDREVTFKSVLVTDKLLNPCTGIHLEDGSASDQKDVSGVPHYRKHQIKWLYGNIETIIRDFPKLYAGQRSLAYSECYATIAQELELIMTIPHCRRVILVYSDLMENNESFDFYKPETLQLVKENPEKVAQMLYKKRPMPDDMRGVRVYFLYNPRNKAEDARFQSILKVYEHLLEIRGARMIVQADYNNIR